MQHLVVLQQMANSAIYAVALAYVVFRYPKSAEKYAPLFLEVINANEYLREEVYTLVQQILATNGSVPN